MRIAHSVIQMGHITLFSTKPMETAEIFEIQTLNKNNSYKYFLNHLKTYTIAI